MQESIQEFMCTPGCNIKIDREQGILHGIKIIGTQSRNGRVYPNNTLREAMPLYENTKVNLDHPEGNPRQPRSYQDRFGLIRNVRLKENDGLYGDFRFNPKHPLAEQLLWDAENAPENVGFSHNVEAIIRREDTNVIVEKIVSVRSVDIVTDPATTSGLFESENDDTAQTKTQELLPQESSEENQEPLAEEATLQESRKENTSKNSTALVESLLDAFKKAVPHAETILNEAFLETFKSLPDDALRLRLLEDRFQLLRKWNQLAIPETKPICREQFTPESPVDTASFLKQILR